MNPSSVIIRPAKKEDLPRVAQLAADLIRFHHSLDSARFFLTPRLEEGYEWFLGTEMERKESILLVAERTESDESLKEIIGYAWGRLEPRDWMELRDACGRLHEIFVVPSARKFGAGKRLLQETLQWLENRGAPRIILTSAWQNKDAHQFFESIGFRYTMVEMTRERSV